MEEKRFKLTVEEQKDVYFRVKKGLDELLGYIRPIEAARIRQIIDSSTREAYKASIDTYDEEKQQFVIIDSDPLQYVAWDVAGIFLCEFTGYEQRDIRRMNKVFYRPNTSDEEKGVKNGFTKGEYLSLVIDSKYMPAPTLRSKRPLKISRHLPNLAEL